MEHTLSGGVESDCGGDERVVYSDEHDDGSGFGIDF